MSLEISGSNFLYAQGYSNNKQGTATKTVDVMSSLITEDKEQFNLKLEDGIEKTDKKQETLADRLNNAKSSAPYSFLADANGFINYEGTTYVCDTKNNAICLGDMTQTDKVLTIPLSGGGCLKVNRDNIDSLAGSIGMFSPEDIKRILAALAQDAKCTQMKYEIDELESNVASKSAEPAMIEEEEYTLTEKQWDELLKDREC